MEPFAVDQLLRISRSDLLATGHLGNGRRPDTYSVLHCVVICDEHAFSHSLGQELPFEGSLF